MSKDWPVFSSPVSKGSIHDTPLRNRYSKGWELSLWVFMWIAGFLRAKEWIAFVLLFKRAMRAISSFDLDIKGEKQDEKNEFEVFSSMPTLKKSESLLRSSLLHSFALCSFVLCSIALCSFALCSFVLYSFALCSFTLLSFALHSFALRSFAL